MNVWENPMYLKLCKVYWGIAFNDISARADILAARADMAEELGDYEEVIWCRVLEKQERVILAAQQGNPFEKQA